MQSCFKDVLNRIRRESKNTVELGTSFENMTKNFFASDKHYKDRFKSVKLWAEYEDRDGRDIGIDLVATEWNGDLCAIQCKCYADNSHLDMKKVATFLASAIKFKNKILVYTGESLTDHAETVLKKHDCKKIREDLEESSIDWCEYPRFVVKKSPKLHNYQEDAVAKTLAGFTKNVRGKLIMACGTGKTLVSMHIAEEMIGKGGIVLYLVPSISLIQQSMRSWSNNANIPHRYMAVCSDKTVSEGGSITELESPATTNPYELKPYINRKKNDALTVVFSTHQSIDVVRKALVGKSVDLTICDEAHRTTGMEGKSYYTMIHEDSNIRSKKRLYMTATPRVYSDAIKANSEKQVYSMDDEKYGAEFYKLSFTDAVHKYDALSDFKVKIAVVPEELISTKYQQVIAKNMMLPLNEEARMAAIWHGIQYPDDDETRVNLLQRVITFFNRIDKSEMFAGERLAPDDTDRSFDLIVKRYNKVKHGKNMVEVNHIDGKDNARTRRSRMNWLAQSNTEPNKCRILSNARCLSEGVDVPALDGIVFADPRQSVVDVVQSVGRVMRKFKGKKYGYVILPVAIPAGIRPHDAFDRNGPFKVVWQVLNGLRSHDEDFAREINQLILSKTGKSGDKKLTSRISVSVLDQYWEDDETLDVFLEEMKTKLVKHVGDMHYYDKYGAHLGRVATIVEERLKKEIVSSSEKNDILIKFYKNLQILINESITKEDAIKVISQHIILSRVFNELFAGEFTSYNPISRILDNMAVQFGLTRDLQELEDIGFYDEVKQEVKGIKEQNGPKALEARQYFIKTIYGNFFKSAAKKETEQHGVVYTPIEVIDFIINSVEFILQNEFGVGFNNRSVKVMDPFAGTGTFLSRLLESGYITTNLYEKYKHDLYANEVILLAYYIATVNIETTYFNLRNSGKYVPFEGINYADTLRLNARYREDPAYRHKKVTIDNYFKKAHERIQNQRWSHVHVIMGNPPYSAGQSSFNDNNPNIKYDELDQRIKSTYIQKTKVTNVNSLYDSYIRSLRWASDRIGKSGIIAFVTNASFIRSESAAGIRACLQEEFTDVWCFDLRGNQRTQGETSRREGGKIFGSGSRAPVAITILVKNSKKKTHDIHYKDIGDYLTREQKLNTIKDAKSISKIKDWQSIHPDEHYDWLNHRDVEFNKYTAMGSKKAKLGTDTPTIFKNYSMGVGSSRDIWAYNSSKNELEKNMKRHIIYCNNQDPDNPIINSKKAKWSSELSKKLKKHKPTFDKKLIRVALYRPFFKQFLYFEKSVYIHRPFLILSMFPKNDSENLVICVPYKFIGEFSTFMTNITPDIQIMKNGQCFPLYTYTDNQKRENITNFALQEYREHYNDNKITKIDIFYYVYGILHHPKYKKKFANNLTRELPRIPMAPDFWGFSKNGKKLADLHLNFERGKRCKLGQPLIKFSKFESMRFARKNIGNGKSSNDKTKLLINGSLAFENIPKIDYKVNGRTPLEWLVDRYKITVDKESGIINDPTDVDIVPLIEQAVHIGVESDRMVSSLPTTFEPKNWKPKRTGLDVHLPSENFQSML